MKKKQIEITPPEGYEIDKENSTFECIKFKSTKVHLYYSDITHTIMNSGNTRYIDNFGNIRLDDAFNINFPNSAPSDKQLKKVLAINQLMNIAKYYNEDWEPNWSLESEKVYVIKYDKYNKYSVWCWDAIILGCVCFKNRSDAQAVIDNPNFRYILDTIFK